MIAHQTTPKRPSLRTAAVMDRFGIDFETEPVIIAESFALPDDVRVVAFVGESGAGKSTLMRHVAASLDGVVDIDAVEMGDRPLIDRLGGTVDEAIARLGRCGLAEARLMLRLPSELSEGQRYRFRIAAALDAEPRWIAADEFTATLDRTLAKVVARNVARAARAQGCGVLLATTHEDVLADLDADLIVRCRLDEPPELMRR